MFKYYSELYPEQFQIINDSIQENEIFEINGSKVLCPDPNIYSPKLIEKISIDYSLLENLSNIMVISAAFKWSDIGTHSELFKVNQTKNVIYSTTQNHNEFFLMILIKSLLFHLQLI